MCRVNPTLSARKLKRPARGDVNSHGSECAPAAADNNSEKVQAGQPTKRVGHPPQVQNRTQSIAAVYGQFVVSRSIADGTSPDPSKGFVIAVEYGTPLTERPVFPVTVAWMNVT